MGAGDIYLPGNCLFSYRSLQELFPAELWQYMVPRGGGGFSKTWKACVRNFRMNHPDPGSVIFRASLGGVRRGLLR